MSMKNLSGLSRQAGPSWPKRGLRRRRDRRTSSDAFFNRAVLPFVNGHARPTLPAQQLHQDDYQIALVPRADRNHQARSPRQRSIRFLFIPLTWHELLERVRRTRSETTSSTSLLRFGEVRVDLVSMEVTRSETPVVLTAQQFKLLRFLLQRPERVISREELLNEVWGYKHYPSTRTVDNHIWVLRQKLELDPAHPIHFLTVHGVGYKFVP